MYFLSERGLALGCLSPESAFNIVDEQSLSRYSVNPSMSERSRGEARARAGASAQAWLASAFMITGRQHRLPAARST
jgi:hypothetical protein